MMTTEERYRHDDGFGLIEMLVVLAILGMVLSIALPGIRSNRAENPSKFVQQVAAMAQATRLDAIKKNESRTLMLSVSDRNIRTDGRDDVLHVPRSLDFSVTFGQRQDVAIKDARIIFFPSGGSTGGSIRFSRGKKDNAAVTINWLTGAIGVEENVVTP